ncbi:MAG: response regulator, partial [Proteobacteria bacterium]|nr:response regulator [Pseudomonadota bacterium]
MDIHEVRRWTSELNVLVVEDDEALRESFQQLLSYLFAEVDAAVDGQDALDQLAAKNYDIVLTDLRMPRMSGFQLLQEIRQQSPQQPIVVISAHEDEVLRRELAVYKVHYLSKPVILEELLKVVIP